MQCPQCGRHNPAQSKFCLECGVRLLPRCGACGTDLPDGAKFCNQCGAPVGAPASPPAPSAPAQDRMPAAARDPAPGAYTPKHLAERILTSKSALEGERKQVTVLFVDIVESSRLAERLDPELMHEIMDRVLRLMAEAVHRYEGTVNQFLGDGLMALFGAPLALEDHAVRAVQAALAIQETVSGYSEQLRVQRGVEVRLRLGLNSGPVVVGRIGDDLRMDYTAIGDTTHLASRMQALAEPGTILVTDATRRLVEGYVRTAPVGPVQVKGRSEPVSVFNVTGRRRWRSRLEVSADVGLSELVGREQELAAIQECLARVKAGRGQVVGLVGDAGVGKSRLLYEFRKAVQSERLTWIEGHCLPYGQTTPLLPILEILRVNFGIEDGDNPLQIEEKIRQGLRRLDAGLDRILPFLGDLFALPREDDVLRHLDPKDKRQRTFEAIRALTFAGSQRQPHVIVIEDLQWIDRTTEDHLASVVDSMAGVPLLLVTTHRPGYAVRWADKTYYRPIALDVLSEVEVNTMVSRLLGTRDAPPDLIRRIHEKAEGNPLFVEEISTSLLERGLLVRGNGGFVWAAGAEVEFPGTVHDIIRARLDRLDDPVKRTAQTAAVIGRQFGLNLLARVCEIAQEVERYLETLMRLELIHETRVFPEREFMFKHAAIQDASYQSLLTQRRRDLHGAIGRAIEDLHADRLDDQASILAYHYARSEQPDRAIAYALRAGDRAVGLYATAEATTYYEQALKLARALPPSPDAQRTEIDVTLRLATVAATRPDIERNLRDLGAACATAEQLGDRVRLSQALYWLGRLEYVLGNSQSAVGYASRSLEIADALGDDALAAPPVNLLGRAYWLLCAFDRASELLERSAEQMLRLGNKSDAATTAAFAGLAFTDLGEFERALALADQGVRLADEIQNPFAQGAACFFRGGVRGGRGEWASAIQDYEQARSYAEKVGDVFRIYVVGFWEGWAHAISGNPMRGRSLIEESAALGERIGTRFQMGRCRAVLAACRLMVGEPEGVEALCRDAIRAAEDTGEKSAQAFGYRVLADILHHTRPSDVEAAESALQVSIGIQEEIGSRPELARSHAHYGQLLAARGEHARARVQIETAMTMFRQMGMAWDLDRAASMLRALRG